MNRKLWTQIGLTLFSIAIFLALVESDPNTILTAIFLSSAMWVSGMVATDYIESVRDIE